jgi:hypothetical protein
VTATPPSALLPDDVLAEVAFIGLKLVLQAGHKVISTSIPEIPSIARASNRPIHTRFEGSTMAFWDQLKTKTQTMNDQLRTKAGQFKSDWKFRAVGQGYASGLSGIARDYGVTV